LLCSGSFCFKSGLALALLELVAFKAVFVVVLAFLDLVAFKAVLPISLSYVFAKLSILLAHILPELFALKPLEFIELACALSGLLASKPLLLIKLAISLGSIHDAFSLSDPQAIVLHSPVRHAPYLGVPPCLILGRVLQVPSAYLVVHDSLLACCAYGPVTASR